MDESRIYIQVPDSIERFYPAFDTLESMIKLLRDRQISHYLHFTVTDDYILVESYKR